MTRITEFSSAYPGGVRKTRTTDATKFYPFACVAPRDTVNSVAPDYYDGEGSIVPTGGSLELAYEPDGTCECCGAAKEEDRPCVYCGTGVSDMDGDDARDQGPADEPAFEVDREPGMHW